jgi:hypothetical protein
MGQRKRTFIVAAIEDCARSACATLGWPDVDLHDLVTWADNAVSHLANDSAGHWKVQARQDGPGILIELLLGDGGLAVDGQGPRPEFSWRPAASARPPGSPRQQPANGTAGMQVRSADGGTIAVLRLDGRRRSGSAASGSTTDMPAFCRWLNGLRIPGAGRPDGESVVTLDARQRATVQQAELVVAYDPAAGHGGWFRRVRRPSTTDPGDRAHPRPGAPEPQKPKSTPVTGQRRPAFVGPRPHDAAPPSAETKCSRGNGSGRPGPDQETLLARRLRSAANPPDLLETLQSSVRGTDSRYPSRRRLADLSPDDRLAKLGRLPKSPGQAWLLAASAVDRDPFAQEPERVRTIRVVDLPGADGRQDTPSSAPGTDGEDSQVVYLVDGAVFDELIYMILGPAGPQGAYARYIEVIKIVIEPRLIVIKMVTMSAGAILHAHGLGVLAPATGRILTRVMVRMLTSILGPGRLSRVESLLDWVNMIAAARAGQLSDSATFRAKLSDLLNRLWNGTRHPRRPRPSYPRPDAPGDARPAGPPPKKPPPGGSPPTGGSPGPTPPSPPPAPTAPPSREPDRPPGNVHGLELPGLEQSPAERDEAAPAVPPPVSGLPAARGSHAERDPGRKPDRKNIDSGPDVAGPEPSRGKKAPAVDGSRSAQRPPDPARWSSSSRARTARDRLGSIPSRPRPPGSGPDPSRANAVIRGDATRDVGRPSSTGDGTGRRERRPAGECPPGLSSPSRTPDGTGWLPGAQEPDLPGQDAAPDQHRTSRDRIGQDPLGPGIPGISG